MMRHVLFASLFVMVGCSEVAADDDSETSTAGLTQMSDQAGIDVQVLQVWTPGRVFPKKSADPWFGLRPGDVELDATGTCSTVDTQQLGDWLDTRLDCVKALGAAAPFDVTGKAGPVLSPIRFTATRNTAPGGDSRVFLDPDYCNMIEVRLVARSAAVAAPSFAGIGFYTSKGDSFAPKSELQEVGRTRLRNGDDATVFRWSGISTCISSAHNSTSGNIYQTFSFKPYAAFDAPQANGDTKRYRVWERIEGNHTLGRSWNDSINRTGFDRQDELLAR